MWFGIPAMGGVMYLINGVTEIFGLQIGGFYGNTVMGSVAEKGHFRRHHGGPAVVHVRHFFCAAMRCITCWQGTTATSPAG